MPDPTTKPCSRCGETKPLDAFYRQKPGLYGRGSRCKSCVSAIRTEWQVADPERYAAHRISEYARLLAWRALHPDRIQAIDARFRETHRERRNAGQRAWGRAHPDVIRERNDLYRARKKAAYVVRVSRRAIYERDGGRCGICGKSVPFDRMHLDHIIPLARGGTHEPKNVQVSHPRCNIRKRSTGPGQLPLLE